MAITRNVLPLGLIVHQRVVCKCIIIAVNLSNGMLPRDSKASKQGFWHFGLPYKIIEWVTNLEAPLGFLFMCSKWTTSERYWKGS